MNATCFPNLPNVSGLLAASFSDSAPRPEDSGPGHQSAREAAIAKAVVVPLRILVVDDEPAIRELLALFLSADGHTVEAAPDSLIALERVYSGNWDVVLLDRAMPGMSGAELAVAIKKYDARIPIVMVSGSPERIQSSVEHCAAIDAMVRKPFTSVSLREGIGHALQHCSKL